MILAWGRSPRLAFYSVRALGRRWQHGDYAPAGRRMDRSPRGPNLRDHPMFTVTVDSQTNFTAFNTASVIPGPGGIAQRLYGNGSGALTQGRHRLQFWTSNEGSGVVQCRCQRGHHHEAVPHARVGEDTRVDDELPSLACYANEE